MGKINAKVILFNAAAGLVAVTALAAVVRSVLSPSAVSPCGERYTNSIAFQLERNGQILTPIDIQARVGIRDDGLAENVDVVKPRDTRIPTALRVSLRNPQATDKPASGKGGMTFPWSPKAVQSETAACLSYNVFLHGDLDYQGGGTLPGLRGADRTQQTQDGFVANLSWRQDGLTGVALSVMQKGEPQRVRSDVDNISLGKGRWIKVEQEVILNAPGRDDGKLRLWLDGALALDRSDVIYRNTGDVTIAGVSADVFYGREDAAAYAQSETKIWVSPFELSWK